MVSIASLSLSLPSVHGKVPLPTLDASEVQEVRTELVTIRNKVNTLLNALDGASSKSGGTTNAIPVSSTPKAPDTIKQSAPSSNMSSVARTGVWSIIDTLFLVLYL